ncbi:eukaryotic translation initiation factor 3 subunit L isoform X2 [Cimex lectularius]|uniref:Eukaryotic translation initiation factor 3 subunit L n=1 Tax=Cimex lectularius TaxID=79782 RepID=A0A8I6RQY4_CIMLE|nr:eukaryotic translation initiation factor 3 subunit L isoform X2 [Cimex lectularius]
MFTYDQIKTLQGVDDNGYDYDSGQHYDSEGERGKSVSHMHEEVASFITYFFKCINEGRVFEIQNMYENSFTRFSEIYFEKKPWPSEQEVMQIMGKNTAESIPMVLYKELYFRHLHANLPQTVTLEYRISSFSNYCTFINKVMTDGEPVNLVLPDQWLWEIIDELIYQFQSFILFKARLFKNSPDEYNAIVNDCPPTTWNVLCVLNILHSLIDKSNIKKQLEVYARGGDPNSVAGDYGKLPLYKMLGYFSLVGLLRLHSLLGDYYLAIKVLENIDIHEMHKKTQYAHVPACQISTSYYVGFAYMMMRRYSDAIRTFSSILLYIQRTKQLFQSKTYQNDQIKKQTDQMYHLLAICLVLHPQCIDDSIQQYMKDNKLYEKMYNMQKGELEEFKSCFQFACPKFLSIPPPKAPSSTDHDYVMEAINHQTDVFMQEVTQQIRLPMIRSFLKLYTTLPLIKLTTLVLNANNCSTPVMSSQAIEKEKVNLRTTLLCFKHKMKNVVWTKGTSGLEGSFQSGSELDFYIDHDMIHIADTRVANRYGDFFIRKIVKFEELSNKIYALKLSY